MKKTYSGVILLETFEERIEYLMLYGKVAEDTFGSYRYMNQTFYHSEEWKKIRRSVIIRDSGCDVGLQNRRIQGYIYVHHIEPVTADDIMNYSEKLVSLDNLICVSKKTHDLIHYGHEIKDPYEFAVRKPNDTCLWK